MRGFTIIELIIYIGIVSLVLVVVSSFAWNIIQGNIKTSALREVQQNADFAMEKITQAIRAALEIEIPSPGQSKNELKLRMADPDLDPTIFEVNDGKLIMKQGPGEPYELTTDQVKVSNLRFTNLSYLNTPGAIKVEIKVDHFNPAGRPEYNASVNLNSTSSLLPGGAAPPVPGLCQGTPDSCDTFGSENDCNNQEGCSWNPGYCQGDCTPCQELSFFQCWFQDGCYWNWWRWKCLGSCTSCDSYTHQSQCQNQLGCSWTSGFCSGSATPCENYTTQATCESQQGCQWVTP